MRDALAAKLKEREAQLAALRHQQDESRKLAKDKEAGEKRIKVLEGEISKMSQQAEALKARLLQDDSRFAQEKAQHACKVRELKAQADEKIAALEAANARQREELVDARQALRQTVGSRGGTHGGRTGTKEWLDREMDKFLKRKEAMEELEREVARREEVVRAKEELLRHQAALDLKRRRCREEARASISGLQVKLVVKLVVKLGSYA